MLVTVTFIEFYIYDYKNNTDKILYQEMCFFFYYNYQGMCYKT